MAVSIGLLQLYPRLFERSCDAINAITHAIHSFYMQRGFNVINKKVPIYIRFGHFIYSTPEQGQPVRDPFCGGFLQAHIWFSNLRDLLDTIKTQALAEAEMFIASIEVDNNNKVPLQGGTPCTQSQDPATAPPASPIEEPLAPPPTETPAPLEASAPTEHEPPEAAAMESNMSAVPVAPPTFLTPGSCSQLLQS